MSSRTVYVSTDVDGNFEWERTFFGIVRGIALELGTLETPDIAVTDDIYGRLLLGLPAASADAIYQPGWALADSTGEDLLDTYAPAAVGGRIRVTVAGGGSQKTGRIHLLLES